MNIQRNLDKLHAYTKFEHFMSRLFAIISFFKLNIEIHVNESIIKQKFDKTCQQITTKINSYFDTWHRLRKWNRTNARSFVSFSDLIVVLRQCSWQMKCLKNKLDKMINVSIKEALFACCFWHYFASLVASRLRKLCNNTVFRPTVFN